VLALARGLHTALVEKEDFASGTSSKSTKLVHGGVRYLEKAVFNLDYGQLKLVFEALHERKRMLENAPHLCSALPIMTVGAPPLSLLCTRVCRYMKSW
jgi:glycerol-3-phosphate dehydrogenase